MLRTILFYAYFWSVLVLSVFIALPFWLLGLLGLDKPLRPALMVLVSAWARSVLAASGARISVEGLERIPDEKRLCLMGNHQGDMDFVLILAHMRRSLGFIAKKEVRFIPIINLWISVLGGTFLDRGNPGRALASIERGVRRIREGRAMLIFPEGTRSKRRAMGPFRNGSLKLATKSGATIVPFTLDGTFKAWEEFRRIRPAEMRLVFHEPIRTADMTAAEKRLLPDRLWAIVNAGLDRDSGTRGSSS